MEQLSFFAEVGQTRNLPMDMLEYRPGLTDRETGDRLLAKFIRDTPWKQTMQKMWEKEYLTPRLTAWCGDMGSDYSVSGKISNPMPWTAELLMIKELVERLAGIQFNSVLLNYYRDGNDSVAWHSDKESILGKRPVIASVSFGQVRSFDIRNKLDHKEHYSVRLEHGSFMLRKAGLQEAFEHRIAKSATQMRPRINLTFRVVKSNSYLNSLSLYMASLTEKTSKSFERKDGSTLAVRIEPDFEPESASTSRVLDYRLYEDDLGMFDLFFTTVFPEPEKPERVFLAWIIFDNEDNWIYDGEVLTVFGQEELAEFIINYKAGEPND